MEIEKLVKEKQGTIVDVRTPAEFMGAAVSGSVNVPLQQLAARLEELKKLPQPLILCCASGGRSGQAYQFLKQRGVECLDGGSWLDINYLQS